MANPLLNNGNIHFMPKICVTTKTKSHQLLSSQVMAAKMPAVGARTTVNAIQAAVYKTRKAMVFADRRALTNSDDR